MTKANPINTIKLWVMINSIIALMAVWVWFAGQPSADVTASLSNNPQPATLATADNNPVLAQTLPSQNNSQANDELANLPYVSGHGLQQQATAQLVSYQRPPRVKARSSR